MKNVIALVAILFVGLSATVQASDSDSPVKSEGGTVVDSQGQPVSSGKY